MITLLQQRFVKTRAGLRILDGMWEQRRRWWVNHLTGNLEREAVAAAKSAELHGRLIAETGLPDLLVRQWEEQWDHWFEKHLKFLERKHA